MKAQVRKWREEAAPLLSITRRADFVVVSLLVLLPLLLCRRSKGWCRVRVCCLALILLACGVVQQPQMCSHCRHCDHKAMEFLGTSCIWDVVFFSVRLCVKSPSAVYFRASTNIDPHAACALFRPALNWIFQQNDFVCCSTSGRDANNILVLLLCLISNKLQNDSHLFVWLWCTHARKRLLQLSPILTFWCRNVITIV